MPSPEPITPPPTGARSAELPRRLLIVEDDEDVREVLPTFLAHPDVTIETACDFDSGVEKAWKLRPHAMLVDIRLGGRTGFELFVELRKARPTVRIMLMSAFSASDVARRAEDLGAYGFVRKPFDERARRTVLGALGIEERADRAAG